MFLLGLLAPFAAQAQSTNADPVLTQKLASEYANFTLSTPTRIAYGIPGKMRAFDLAAGKYLCGNQLEGVDPAPGIEKVCYSTPSLSALGPKLANEYDSFTLATASRISYGAGSTMRAVDLAAGKYTCGNALAGDPLPGIAKACYGTSALPVLGQKLSDEYGQFVLTAPTRVAFGIPGKMRVTLLPAGTHSCDRLQGVDPAPGIVKACYGPTTLPLSTSAVPIVTTPTAPVGTTPVTPPVVTPPTPTVPTAPTNPTTPTAAIVEPGLYRSTAATFGTDAGIAYRYGLPANMAVATTYSGPRASKPTNMVSVQNPNGLGTRGCGWTSYCGNYQIGELKYEAGDYSSNSINIAYIADVSPGAGWAAPKYWGLANLQQFAVSNGVVSITPEVSWTRYDGAVREGGANDLNITNMATGHKDSGVGYVPINGKPVATTRGYGRGGWTNNNLTVWSDGLVTSSGSNTSNNYMALQLPTTDKVPTGIAISNSGEFAFVTVWDTANIKGQVGVIALSDGCAWCYMKNEGTSVWERNWGSARRAFPGFPGLGNYNGGKFIGWIDLPSDMKAPTEVAVTTGKDVDKYYITRNLWDDDIQVESNRKRQYNGDQAEAVPRAGMLAVISKGEKKAAFYDLRPLFMYYREQYLNQPQAQWNAMMANRGDAPSQWPYSFDNTPSQKPKLIKTVTLDDEPTAVRLTPTEPYRALIGTTGGSLRVFDLGPNYLDQRAALTGTPSDINELFRVQAGANVTSIAHVKEKSSQAADGVRLLYGYEADNNFMWTLSRGEKKATMWQFNKARTSMTAFRTLQDSHMADPIALEDGDNHGTESYTITFADYAGKAVHTYTYGGIRTWTEPTYPCPTATSCLPANGAQFEYFGKYVLPGKPFHLGSANVN